MASWWILFGPTSALGQKLVFELRSAAARTDLDEIWKMLLAAAKLEIFDTLTRGSGGVTFIEHV